jgi:PAS domain S-box-containing protein
VLCVATQPGMAELASVCLERADGRITAVTATTVADALDCFRQEEFDCIVSEYHIGDADGLVLLEAVRASDPDLPCILFTRNGSEGVASRAITAGATDYLEQTAGLDQYEQLADRLLNAVEQYRQQHLTVPVTERAETTLEPAVDPVVVSVDGECVYANEAARELGDGGVIEEPIDEVLGVEQSTVAAVEDGDQQFETLRLDADSTPVTVTARRIDWDGDEGAVCVCPSTDDRGRDLTSPEPHGEVFDAVFSNGPDGILVTGPDDTVLTYNEQFASLWGIDAAALEGAEFDFVGTLLANSVDQPANFEQTFGQCPPDEGQRRRKITLDDGRVFEQYTVSLDTAGGDRLGTAVHYRDLSQIGVENVREPVFDRMSDAICILDDDWRFTYVNDHATELTDRSRDDLLGQTLWEAFPGLDGTELERKYREALESGHGFTTETYYDPLKKYLEIRVFPAETGLKIYFRDISHRRTAEEELRQTIDELEALYELAADQDTAFETRRKRLLQVGTEYFDLPYGFVSKVDGDEQRIAAAVGDHELLQPGETCALEQSYCRKTVLSESGLLAVEDAGEEGWDGDPAYETFELGTYIGAKLLVDGELYGTLCFASTEPRDREFSDSERTLIEVMARWLSYEYSHRAYQQQLEEQNDRLERFASMVSHDLRNPLDVAMTRVELLGDETDSEHLDSVAQAHDRMEELIEDILLLARQDSTVEDPPTVALDAVATRAWEGVETGDASLSVSTTDSLPADESLLTEAFENLYRNAVEHGTTSAPSQTQADAMEHGTDDGGADLTVTVGTLDDGFYVADDGDGIPLAERDRIFEEGVSNAGGNGLGLSIVSKIVDAHGWQITATDSDAGGARFEITGVE